MRGEIPFSIVTVINTGSEFNQWGAEMTNTHQQISVSRVIKE
jgi:hypothetical protein